MTSYEKIMGIDGSISAPSALTQRLISFRQWLHDEAKAEVHPAICIVNGEATDGTKNAPVLVFERHESVASATAGNSSSSTSNSVDGTVPSKKFEGRVGIVDGDSTAALYDRTMGCQVRAVREIKKDETMLRLPRTSMITPDLVAASDAGRAVLSCCKASDSSVSYWDSLTNTSECEAKFASKVAGTGPQILVKILQERKRAETALKNRLEAIESGDYKSITGDGAQYRLAEFGLISTRAPFLAFLIHQRFSNSENAPVISDKFVDSAFDLDENALKLVREPINIPPGAPLTFSPYTRVLPSYVSILLCWKRNELAMLAGCIPGLPLLQEVGSSTLHLVTEFTALLDAGILERFPDTFPPGLLTWERWVWAAAVFSSRNLPASGYIGSNENLLASERQCRNVELQSPLEIWNEVGVMIPLLDMLNHEAQDHQVTWLPPQLKTDDDEANGTDLSSPKAMIHKKVKKGSEIFCCYGLLSNAILMLQYGFAQMSNLSDEVRLGWALADAVGNVEPPFDYIPPHATRADDVYESNDETAINHWWTDERIALLEKEALASADANFVSSLKARKKMTAIAYSDGTYHPILLATVVVATMPMKDLNLRLTDEGSDCQPIVISKRHQKIIQRYLQFTFTRKLEKLLLNLDSGLRGHFSNVKLWTKASNGGIHYRSDGDSFVGWQSFFDANAYKATMEVENRYYAMGTDSCVLALYDGQLRALQASINGVNDDATFATGVLKQLEDLGYIVCKEDDEADVKGDVDVKLNVDIKPEANGESPDAGSHNGVSGSKSPKNRKRNRKKSSNTSSNSDRPPAIKLHIGSLSYTTTPSDLYDYFSSIYGQDNVLECHIPIERETGRSRGFGFVAMPEEMAHRALTSGRKHEIDGRVLKIARSNSAGTVSSVKPPDGSHHVPSDRCVTCGYRPKYCICPRPNLYGHPGQMHGPPTGNRHELPPDQGRGFRDSYRSNGPPDYYRDGRYRDDIERHRYYDRDRERQHYRDEDYRRSYDDDYYRDRSRRDRDRDRSRDRSPDSRSSSRRWDNDDRDRHSSRRTARDTGDESDEYDRSRKRSRSSSRSRSRSRSRSKDKSSRRKKSKRRNRSRSRPENPP